MIPRRVGCFWGFCACPAVFVLLQGSAPPAVAQDVHAKKRIVLIAGKKSHGPVANGLHDYGWSARLTKVMLDNSNIKNRITVDVFLDGWPEESKTLGAADTVMIIADGRDGGTGEEALFLAGEERVRFVGQQMRRGCGLVTFHFSTFAPEKYREYVLQWTGGYFQWETEGERRWYSAIKTLEAEVQPATPDHPIARGLKPFLLREEFYYNLRFSPQDASLKPIWIVPALEGREPDGNIVAWARQRVEGGRGFGTSVGHFYSNWQHEQFRKLILNAIAWTAKVDIPAGGVAAGYYSHDEIEKVSARDSPPR
jgi:type 1 glutamine amidotransferase